MNLGDDEIVLPNNVIRFPSERRVISEKLTSATGEKEELQEEIKEEKAKTASIMSDIKAKVIRIEGAAVEGSEGFDESYLASLLPLVEPDQLDAENHALRDRLLNLTTKLRDVLKHQPVIANVLAEWEWQYFVEPEKLKHPWGIYHTQEKLPPAYALLPFEFVRCVTLFDEIERINALLNRIGLLLSLPSRRENKQRRYELAVRGSWLYALKQRLLKDLDQAEVALDDRYEPIWKKWQQGVQQTVRTLIYKPDPNL
jgi:hypothetical protein